MAQVVSKERPETDAGPKDIDLEQAVLGLILTEDRALKQAKDLLNPVYFAIPAHASIAAICLELVEHGEIANPVSVKQILERRGALDGIGGTECLVRLVKAVTSTRGLRGKVLRLQDLYLRRVLIAEAKRTIAKVSSADEEQTGFEALSMSVARLQELRYKVAKFMGGF